jgi:hypothetical protein
VIRCTTVYLPLIYVRPRLEYYSTLQIDPRPEMILTKLARATATVSLPRLRCVTTQVTWATQDGWDDPRGPLGLARPSPKLAPLTADSPEWMHNLHRDGVSGNRVGVLWKSLCLAT